MGLYLLYDFVLLGSWLEGFRVVKSIFGFPQINRIVIFNELYGLGSIGLCLLR